MAKKSKRVEVLSPHVTYTGDSVVRFSDVLAYACGKKEQLEIKTVEYKPLTTEKTDCETGIVITGQNKDLPPKRNNQTGEFSTLGVNVAEESISFGNILFYDQRLNVLLYEVNLNGCDPERFATFLENSWNNDEEHELDKISIKFTVVVRKSEYERAIRIGFYKEFYAELTNPAEIAQAYKDEHDSLYSLAKQYVNGAIKSNSDTYVVKMTSFGRKGRDTGLDVRQTKKLIDSFHFIQQGLQRHNVTALKVKGYFMSPDEPDTIQPVNLIADSFNEFIKLQIKEQHSDLQESERRIEIERIYTKILPELKRILNDVR